LGIAFGCLASALFVARNKARLSLSQTTPSPSLTGTPSVCSVMFTKKLMETPNKINSQKHSSYLAVFLVLITFTAFGQMSEAYKLANEIVRGKLEQESKDNIRIRIT
jgi:hypothetical protein